MIRSPFRNSKPILRKCTVCRCDYLQAKPLQRVCGPLCAEKSAELKRLKAAAKREQEERQKTRAQKEALKTRSQWIKEAQHAFNAWVREVAKIAGYPCISSGKPLDWSGNGVDAGHYRSIGSAPHLRFDERNCHAQSKHDNNYLSGNAVDYRIGLIKRIGLEAVEALESDNTVRKYTIDDLKVIKATYKAKLKQLLADKEVA